MQTAVRKMGNSEGVILPKAVLKKTRITTGTKLNIEVQDRSVTLTPVVDDPRALWAAELQAAAHAGEIDDLSEDDLAWMNAGNAFDAEWEW